MLAAYVICSVLLSLLVFYRRKDRVLRAACGGFYTLQAAFAVWILCGNVDSVQLEYFRFDRIGILFFMLLALVSPIVYRYSRWYLDSESRREKSIYHSLLMLLCASITCVYFSQNLAVTWIFIEATTICTAGLIYHRRTKMSLEATWKYIFVCSVGISVAYLGILLFGGMTTGGDLNYSGLAVSLSEANPLFLKIAFLFILTGYSCKLEIFPLYNIGVDGNFSAPSPASALISTGLVNAGFIAVFRVYRIMSVTPVFGWVRSVLVIAGILSILVGALFMHRTTHYKRFLAYSTVENMGIVAVGLGIGGLGVYAAIFHAAGHALLKSSMFLQIAQAGKIYGNYQLKRMGGYMDVNRRGAVLLLITAVLMLGFPPSPLFISELLIFKQMVADGEYLLLAVTVLGLCIVMYNIGRNIIRLCYNPSKRKIERHDISWGLIVPVIMLLALSVAAGIWQPELLAEWLGIMVNK